MLLQQAEKELKKIYEEIDYYKKRALKSANLKVRIKRNGTYYEVFSITRSADGVRKEVYISKKNRKLLKTLLNGKYCLDILPILESEALALESFLKEYSPEKKYSITENYPNEFRPILDSIIKPELYAKNWANDSYRHNTFPVDERSGFKTKKGDIVRSKAEKIIADMLYDFAIPYRYEYVLSVGIRDYYPDFTIMHPETNELYYVEYFGLMEDTNYAESAFRKMHAYQAAGLAERCIFFFEKPNLPMDTQAIEETLKSMFC